MKAEGLDRAARVGDQIQRELATIIARELDDPRVRGVTVSGVSVSRDMRHARVYVTPPDAELALLEDAGRKNAPARLTDQEQIDSVLRALRSAAPRLRKRLGQAVRLRYLPRLEFIYDSTLDTANHLDALLRDAARTTPDQFEGAATAPEGSPQSPQHHLNNDQPPSTQAERSVDAPAQASAGDRDRRADHD